MRPRIYLLFVGGLPLFFTSDPHSIDHWIPRYYSNGNRNCSSGIEDAWAHVGMPRPRAVQVDRCRWNFQAENTEKHCYNDFTCGQIRAIHKKVRPDRDGQKGTGCFYYADGKTKD